MGEGWYGHAKLIMIWDSEVKRRTGDALVHLIQRKDTWKVIILLFLVLFLNFYLNSELNVIEQVDSDVLCNVLLPRNFSKVFWSNHAKIIYVNYMLLQCSNAWWFASFKLEKLCTAFLYSYLPLFYCRKHFFRISSPLIDGRIWMDLEIASSEDGEWRNILWNGGKSD